MEVHHHPHVPHGKKKIKEYFLEFFMIFLAVTMGFFAEGLREHNVEKSKEREFMESMVREMRSDSVQIASALKDSTFYDGVDSLSINLLSRNYTPKKINDCYRQFYSYALNFRYVTFNRNTLTQLKNAGNMRLIRNQKVVDSLISLDNAITACDSQLSIMQTIAITNGTEGLQIFDGSYRVVNGKFVKHRSQIKNIKNQMKFNTNNIPQIVSLGSKLMVQAGGFRNYNSFLQEIAKIQNRLIPFIIKEYNLDEEEINNEKEKKHHS